MHICPDEIQAAISFFPHLHTMMFQAAHFCGRCKHALTPKSKAQPAVTPSQSKTANLNTPSPNVA